MKRKRVRRYNPKKLRAYIPYRHAKGFAFRKW